ncbi:ATP-dependent DNA helicase PIF1 [Linum perenne]
MSEDFAHRKQQLNSDEFNQPHSIQLYDQLLHNLKRLLHSYSLSLKHFNLPEPLPTTTYKQNLNTILTYHHYDQQIEASKSQKYYSSLNDEQIHAYTSIMTALQNKKGQLFFLHGHGGTGKMFLYNCIISKVRSTAHSRFKIPLEIDNLSTCAVKKGLDAAELLKSATLIVWDEAPMIHKLSFEAVDRTMCDIMNMPLSGENYLPFGGKVVLLGGDFRQTLPVVPNGSREDNINATLPRSYLWNFCTLLHLQINMRILNNPVNTTPIFNGMTFPEWVLAIGVYPSFQKSYQSLQYIKSRAIVSPTNVVISEINNLLLAQIPAPTNLGEYVISGLIVSGTLEETTVAIPRIILDVTDNKWPFTLRRRQFPIRICYAMTINKSQGQTLDHVGIYLPKPVFSHGQLYVAVSRVRSANGLHILISNNPPNPHNETRNIVYQDILHEITGMH